MKTLVFADGSSQVFTENSKPSELIAVFEDFIGVDELRGKMTEENLDGATFDGQTLVGYIPISVVASAKAEGNITVVFVNKIKADVQVEELIQQVAQLQEENEQLTDKAGAADILLGNEEV